MSKNSCKAAESIEDAVLRMARETVQMARETVQMARETGC